MGTDAVTTVAGGVYYTGREDLNLGLDIRWTHLPLENWDISIYPITFGIALRYYF